MTSKSDAPAFRLVVEPGPKLGPASAFDAERLDTYKIGRILRFTPVEEADRKDIRRWWAILNRAVKVTKTPWRSAEQASEAIKLALGIVHYGKTVGGSFMQWPKSLKELDDEELAGAVRDMAALLHKITGVDPLEWSREAADVGHDEPAQQSSAPLAHTDADEGSGTLTSPEPAPASISSAVDTKAAIVAGFLSTATTPDLSTPQERRESLEMSKDMWKGRIISGEFGENPEALVDFLATAWKTVDDVIRGRKPFDDAKTYLEGLIR